MPEGDTVHTLAGLLREYLLVDAACAAHLPRECRRLTAEPVVGVHARGKHLYVEFASGRSLRCHLGLYGSWHRYAPGEAWQRPRRQARLVLDTGQAVLVCFNAAEVEVLEARGDGVRRALARQRTGPDLTRGEAVADIAARVRILADPQAPVVDALLDQRIASGIGNVYKSEVLFLDGIHPLTPLAELADGALQSLYDQAARLLASNVGRARRRTRPAATAGGRLWVYGRGGRACRRCGATIRAATLGRHWRVTCWCPACQRPGSGTG